MSSFLLKKTRQTASPVANKLVNDLILLTQLTTAYQPHDSHQYVSQQSLVCCKVGVAEHSTHVNPNRINSQGAVTFQKHSFAKVFAQQILPVLSQ